MVSLAPIAVLFGVFLWVGLSTREFDGRVQRRVVVLITVVVVLDLLGVFGLV